MKNTSLIASLLGLLILSILLFTLPPVKVQNPQDLSNLKDNDKIIVEGKVVEERIREDRRILTLDNSIVLECSCISAPSFKHRHISAVALIDKYNNKNYVKVLNIKIND